MGSNYPKHLNHLSSFSYIVNACIGQPLTWHSIQLHCAALEAEIMESQKQNLIQLLVFWFSLLRRAAASESLSVFLAHLHDSVCVCVCGGRVWSVSTDILGGLLSRWSTLWCLKKLDVGRKRRPQCQLWCWFLIGRFVSVYRQFICVQLRCQKKMSHYSSSRVSASIPADRIFLVLYFNLCSLTPARLVRQPTPLHFHRGCDLILPSGINKVHFILPVWVGLITECCLRVADF